MGYLSTWTVLGSFDTMVEGTHGYYLDETFWPLSCSIEIKNYNEKCQIFLIWGCFNSLGVSWRYTYSILFHFGRIWTKLSGLCRVASKLKITMKKGQNIQFWGCFNPLGVSWRFLARFRVSLLHHKVLILCFTNFGISLIWDTLKRAKKRQETPRDAKRIKTASNLNILTFFPCNFWFRCYTTKARKFRSDPSKME